MSDRIPRLVVQGLALALVTALAGGAIAQDRVPKGKPAAAKPERKRPAKRRSAKKASPATKVSPKEKRDAADDALFGGEEKPPRPPVSTDGAWPAEDDSAWPTEDDSPWPAEQSGRDARAEEEELFGDLDEDMQSPTDQQEAEERGSTQPQPAAAATPSPDASDWRVTARGPEVLDWREGSDLPPGYAKSTQIRKGLVIAGAVTFGASWLATAAYGTYLINERDPGYWERGNDEEARPEAVLYVPLVGPWIALGTVENDRRERAAFIAGGVVQAGGLAMLIAGVAAKQTVLVKTGNTEVGLLPSVAGPHGTGAMMHGSF